MEKPDYFIGKRYSDCLKTMYFTFFYCSILPIGILWSLLGIFSYFFIDKFNIISRRVC